MDRKFSPLKRNVVLLILRDYEMADVISIIKEFLTVTTEQVFYIIDHLISSKWVQFEEGKLVITQTGHTILKEANLTMFSLKNIDTYKHKIEEKVLENYIPKKQ